MKCAICNHIGVIKQYSPYSNDFPGNEESYYRDKDKFTAVSLQISSNSTFAGAICPKCGVVQKTNNKKE